jgi:Mn-dependent DtxR family transcriptional regulator
MSLDMLIGSDFNHKMESILLKALKLSESSNQSRISVEELNQDLELDRNELKNYLEYLSDKNFLILSTIGGPFLYGHIELTTDGLKKANKIHQKSKNGG